MIQLSSITLREIRLPLKEPFRISSGLTTERRIALLELRDATGTTAWSECVAGESPNYSPETIDTAWLAITEWLAPRMIGRTIEAPGDVFPVLDEDIRGHLMAKAAIEMGTWGLEANRLGMPLSKLIGGTRPEIDVGISLGIQPNPDALATRVRESGEERRRSIVPRSSSPASVPAPCPTAATRKRAGIMNENSSLPR